MASPARSAPDQAALAYEVMLGTALSELGFADRALARSWAAFWLCDPQDAEGSAAAARTLAADLVGGRMCLSAIAQIHCRLTALEIRHLAGDGAARLSDWLEASNARLVLLLAGVEGERVSAAPAPGRLAMDPALAAIAEAAQILNRGLDELRAAAPAAPRPARRRAA